MILASAVFFPSSCSRKTLDQRLRSPCSDRRPSTERKLLFLGRERHRSFNFLVDDPQSTCIVVHVQNIGSQYHRIRMCRATLRTVAVDQRLRRCSQPHFESFGTAKERKDTCHLKSEKHEYDVNSYVRMTKQLSVIIFST